jgi:hypothetical protein
MKTILPALLTAAFCCALASPAEADQMAASCARLLGISNGEAGYIYVQAEADLGTETAKRLWGVYHRLRGRCAARPGAQIVVTVEPRVKQFLEAYR